MQYYVKERLDEKVALIAADGYALDVFDSVDEAVSICVKECRTVPLWIEWKDGLKFANLQQSNGLNWGY